MKTLLVIALSAAILGCVPRAHFVERTCANIINDSTYIEGSDYKAIASFWVPEENNLPPGDQVGSSECWFQTEAATQALAAEKALELCEENLALEQNSEGWTCNLVAIGDELTEAEANRIGVSDRNYRGASSVVDTRTEPMLRHNPDRGRRVNPTVEAAKRDGN